jgi:hypothetical protein
MRSPDLKIGNTRSEAVRCALPRYIGKSCRHHPDNRLRWTSNAVCVECSANQAEAWRQRNQKLLVQKRREWSHANPVKTMLQRARRRAKALGLPFELTASQVEIPTHCPVLGIELLRSGTVDSSPSLDRVRNEEGYILSNIRVISHRANRIKSDASKDELLKIARSM